METLEKIKEDVRPDLLETEEIEDLSSEQLDFFKNYTKSAELTDLAILTGAKHISIGCGNYDTYWTKTGSDRVKGFIECIDEIGTYIGCSMDNRDISIRPVLRLSEKLFSSLNIYRFIIKLGEYPQTIADGEIQDSLEEEYQNGTLKQTPQVYIFNKYSPFGATDYYLVPHLVYTYGDTKYIRVRADFKEESFKFDDFWCKKGSYVWVEVEPIEWIVDKKSRTLISKKALVAGVEFNNTKFRNFEETKMYRYLNDYMFLEMFPNSREYISKETEVSYEIDDDTLNSLEKQINTSNLSKEELQELQDALDQYRTESNKSRR